MSGYTKNIQQGISEKELVEKISSLGGKVYIVGGYVRDVLSGRVPHDKDYAVCGLTPELMSVKLGYSSVGKGFPVYLATVEGQTREIALARIEKKTAAGHRGYALSFSPDITIEQDLYRRDTTINSMALRLPDMALIDPYGGVEDIKARVIRATSHHFCEDPVRALRAARQAAQLGFSIHENTKELMQRCASELKGEPSQRLFEELKKALTAPNPQIFFESLVDTKILVDTYPEIYALFAACGNEVWDCAMSNLKKTAVITKSLPARYAALVTTLEEPLRMHASEFRGVKVRVNVPKNWKKLAGFIIQQKLLISPPRETIEIVEMYEKIRRLGLDVNDVRDVIQVVKGELPECLDNTQRWSAAITTARANITIPEEIAPRDRESWLLSEISKTLSSR